VDKLNGVLVELQDRDASIYRAIFEADPISPSIRQGGFGGVEKYRELEGYASSETLINLNKKIDKLSKQMYVQSKSFDELSKLASRKTEFLASVPAIQPLSNKNLRRMASGFGYRVHPIYKTHKMHTGIDFTAPTGTPVYSTGNGRVVKVELGHRGYGNHVVISHGFGYQTLYGHLHKAKVREGQEVKRGQLIGYIGNTGLSSGPHLHYEVIKGSRKINPINYFFNDLNEDEYQAMREMSERPGQSFD
jgi:murein DD-endopeptidase MepM/ murein hydrolase activator NlpD